MYYERLESAKSHLRKSSISGSVGIAASFGGSCLIGISPIAGGLAIAAGAGSIVYSADQFCKTIESLVK